MTDEPKMAKKINQTIKAVHLAFYLLMTDRKTSEKAKDLSVDIVTYLADERGEATVAETILALASVLYATYAESREEFEKLHGKDNLSKKDSKIIQ